MHVTVFVVSAEVPIFGVFRMYIMKSNTLCLLLKFVELFDKCGHGI